MGEVHKENQAKEDEEGSADEGDVVSPEYKETIRDEEGYDHEDKPE
jgi:hypothetical protein